MKGEEWKLSQSQIKLSTSDFARVFSSYRYRTKLYCISKCLQLNEISLYYPLESLCVCEDYHKLAFANDGSTILMYHPPISK